MFLVYIISYTCSSPLHCAMAADIAGDTPALSNGNGEPATDGFDFDMDTIEIDTFKRKPELHGFLKLGWPIHGHNEDSFQGNANIYDQTALTLWFGIDLLRNIAFTTEMEFEDGFDELTFELLQFDWTILDNLLSLRLGRFIYPFGIERFAEDAPTNKLVTRPTPFVRIIPGTYSDNGVTAYGMIPFIMNTRWKYEIALTTGLSGPTRRGEQESAENNDNKSIGGRLGLLVFQGLEIGASYTTGKYDDDDRLRMDFIGLDLAYKTGSFEFRSEYIKSYVEGDAGTSSIDRNGYYAQVSYKYTPQVNYFGSMEWVARFDSVDPDDSVTDTADTDRLSLGVNFLPIEHLIIKLEYVIENEAKESEEKNILLQTIFRW